METLGVAEFLPFFIEQEIDAAVFLRLTRDDIAKIVNDAVAVDSICDMIKRMNYSFGSNVG